MTAKYKLLVIYLLYTICAVHSARIKANIDNKFDVLLQETIDGKHLSEVRVDRLTLFQLVDQQTLPTLTISNFTLYKLLINHIPLEKVPVLINVSTYQIDIREHQIKTIPVNALDIPNLERIRITDGQVDTIEDGAFNSQIVHLELPCNKLTEFSHTWFQSPEKLGILNLSGNRIEHLKNLHHMTGIYGLLLMNCSIATIDSASFGSSLVTLDLSFNSISELSTSFFASDNVTIKVFNIDYNKLSFLSDEVLQKLRVSTITTDGNPWQCSCLKKMEKSFQMKNTERKYLEIALKEPVCVRPVHFGDLCIEHVDSALQREYLTGLSAIPVCHTTGCITCTAPSRRDKRV